MENIFCEGNPPCRVLSALLTIKFLMETRKVVKVY